MYACILPVLSAISSVVVSQRKIVLICEELYNCWFLLWLHVFMFYFRLNGAACWPKDRTAWTCLSTWAPWLWTVCSNAPSAVTVTVRGECVFIRTSYTRTAEHGHSVCLVSRREPSEYITAILDLSKLLVQRQHYLPYHWDWLYWRSEQGRRFRKGCDIVHSFTAKIVQERRSQLKQQESGKSNTKNLEYTGGYKKKDTDLIDLLLLSKASCF